MRVCTAHLRQYNEGLNLSNTIRMCDAFNFLNKYYEEEMKKKTVPNQEDTIEITDTERVLFNLFKGIVKFGKNIGLKMRSCGYVPNYFSYRN